MLAALKAAYGDACGKLPRGPNCDNPDWLAEETRAALVAKSREEAAGWTQCIDEQSGHFYYFDERSGATTWEPPVAMGGEDIFMHPYTFSFFDGESLRDYMGRCTNDFTAFG